MNVYENPIDFNQSMKEDGYEISYSDTREIAQGGPIVGRLSVNNFLIHPIFLFGGPPLKCKNLLYVPVFVRKFCVAGFRLCVINLDTREFYMIGKVKNLIFLDRIDNDKIYFYENLEKSNMLSLDMNSGK